MENNLLREKVEFSDGVGGGKKYQGEWAAHST